MSNEIREQWPFMKVVIVWFLLAVVLVGGLAWAGLISKPLWLSFERKVYVNSHQFVQARKTAIARINAQCVTLPEGTQKQVLRQRIAAEKSQLPQGEISFEGNC